MDYLKVAQEVLEIEANALLEAKEKLSLDNINSFIKVVEYLKSVGGKIVFCGVGKSGIIANKLAATFTSLGIQSIFLHPVEALHGDLGLLDKRDAIVFLSKSGTTSEITKLLPYISTPKHMIIGLLGNMNSPIAEACGINFDCSVQKEACINGQAPTTSSTLALAMGDALAVIYENYVGLSKEGFAQNHPGGLLGKSLRLKVQDLLCHSSECPSVSEEATLKDVILEMTKMPVGGCVILKEDKMLGIIVEGDIRRSLVTGNKGVDVPVSEVMNRTPISTTPDHLAFDALKLMEDRENAIDILPVVGDEQKFYGFIRLHDLLKEGFASTKK